MNTQELKDTCGVCGTIHLGITDTQCDDTLHACACNELISDYGKHICVVEMDYIADNTCEACKQIGNLNDLNLCEDCSHACCSDCGEIYEITKKIWENRVYNHHFIELENHSNCSEKAN